MTAPDRDCGRVRSVLVVAVLSAASLGAAGPSSLPSSVAWTDLERWYETSGPASAAVGLVWLTALVVAVWLVVACLLQLVARFVDGDWIRHLADRVAPAALRGFAVASVTTALALTSPAGAGDAPGTATLHPLDPTEEVTATSSTVVTSPVHAPAQAATPAPVPDGSSGEYTIQPGDSFWSVARTQVANERRGASARTSLHEYWRRLIAANAGRLVDAGNPDLLYPGQVVVLPPLT